AAVAPGAVPSSEDKPRVPQPAWSTGRPLGSPDATSEERKGEHMSVVIAEHLTIDQWLDLHFPDPGPADLIRLEAKSRRDYGNVSYFFTRRGGRWHFPPDARINFDEPSACVSRNRDTEMTLSPLLYQHSPMPNAPARLPLLWACLPLKIVASRFDPALGAVDAESERTAFARLDA